MELGVLAGVFGLQGEVRVHLHNRESTWLDRRRQVVLVDPAGKRWSTWIKARSGAGGKIIGRLEGVDTREAAEALAGARLMVPRGALPPPDPDEFYVHDVEGLDVVVEGAVVGRVVAVHATGPVDVLEIEAGPTATSPAETCWVPCVRERIVSIDLEARQLVLAPGALVRDEE